MTILSKNYSREGEKTNMSEILISIIVPHYNSPKTLSRLLTSVGIHDDVETIIIDDRSTISLDEYSECRRKFEGENVVFLSNTTDRKGAGTSRNVGLARARGQWLLFADADDFMLSDWYDTVKKYTDDDSDIVYFAPEGDENTGRHLPFVNLVNNLERAADHMMFIADNVYEAKIQSGK